MNIPYFPNHELECKEGKVVECEPIFLMALSTLRHVLNHSLIPNSVCRTQEYNKTIGGHPRSLHQTKNPFHKNIKTGEPLKCCAADISIKGWDHKKIIKFVYMAEQQGWSVRIAKTFIHIDRRELAGLPQHRGYYGDAKEWYESFAGKVN